MANSHHHTKKKVFFYRTNFYEHRLHVEGTGTSIFELKVKLWNEHKYLIYFLVK